MSKLLLLIPLVVLVSGCEKKGIYENYDISFRDFDRDILWSSCVRRELSKSTHLYNNPLYNKAIDILCVIRSIETNKKIHKDKERELEETVQKAIEYNKESKKKASTQSQTSTHNGLTATHNGKNYRQMIPGDDDSWEEY